MTEDGFAARLRNVSKHYLLGRVEVPALRDVTLALPRRRFNVIVGPSGSGKTTLLNLLGCIDAPTAGGVEVCGREISSLTDEEASDFRARNIGFIFQGFSLLPVLSALENVEYPLLLTGAPKTERRELALAMLEAVGLARLRHSRPNELSGGERQRVAVARALVKKPQLVLADEPTANLDSKTGMAIVDLMHGMQAEHETTFIFASHDKELIDRADALVELRDGRLVKGEP